jgi:hypothetical protein
MIWTSVMPGRKTDQPGDKPSQQNNQKLTFANVLENLRSGAPKCCGAMESAATVETSERERLQSN